MQETYLNLTKLQDNLLNKGFCFREIYGISIYSKSDNDDFVSKIAVKQVPSETHVPNTFGYVNYRYTHPNWSIKQEISTSSMFKTTIDCIHAKFPNNKGIITIQNDSANRIYKREVAIEQKNEKYRNRFALSDDPALDFTLVTSNGKFGGGFDTSLALDTFRLKTYDATIYYAHQDYHLALKHISKNPISYALGDLIFSLYYNFKPNFKLGASVTYTSEKTVDITVGSSYELNPDISIKTRGDSEGALALSIRTKISPYVSLLTASQFNVRSLSHNHNPKMEFSFRINLNQ